ncbi:hypothetical protein OAO96_06690 [Amylibacter sp.]|nr:hypothetical protein [Amylibacter sp.]
MNKGSIERNQLNLFFPFIIYLIIITIFYLDDGIPILLKAGRLIFYYLFLVFIVPAFFESSITYKYLKILSLFIGLYLILQYLLLLIGFDYLPGYLPGLPLLREELISHAKNGSSIAFRARSVVGEPSDIGIVMGLMLFLLVERIKLGVDTLNKEKWFLGFVIIVLLLSRSATGFGMVCFCLMYLFTRKDLFIYNIILICCFLLLLFVLQSFLVDLFSSIISRFEIRSGGYGGFAEQENLKIIFGSGTLGKDGLTEWGGGVARLLKFYGILGMSFFILPFVLAKHSQTWFFRCVFILLLSLFTPMPVGPYALLIFSYMFAYFP